MKENLKKEIEIEINKIVFLFFIFSRFSLSLRVSNSQYFNALYTHPSAFQEAKN